MLHNVFVTYGNWMNWWTLGGVNCEDENIKKKMKMIERGENENKKDENSVFVFFFLMKILLLYFIDGKYGNLFDKK